MKNLLHTGTEPDLEELLRDEEMTALLARDGLAAEDVRAHAAAARLALQQRQGIEEAA